MLAGVQKATVVEDYWLILSYRGRVDPEMLIVLLQRKRFVKSCMHKSEFEHIILRVVKTSKSHQLPFVIGKKFDDIFKPAVIFAKKFGVLETKTIPTGSSGYVTHTENHSS